MRKYFSHGMSTIDFMVILFILVATVLVYAQFDNPFGSFFKMMGITFLFLLPLWLYNDYRDKMDLMKLYKKGMVEEQHYINQVGEKFYRKHHGELPDRKK